MKRVFIVAILITALAIPAFSQVRLDLGVSVPLTVGVIGDGQIETSNEIGEFLRSHILPFPEAGLYYQFEAGPVKLAPGIRAFTFILETVLWPNVLMELAFDPVFINVQLGGLLFLAFGLANDLEFGGVLLPDVSVWFGLGEERRFRLGGGVIGLAIPELTTEGLAFAPYLGGKVSLIF